MYAQAENWTTSHLRGGNRTSEQHEVDAVYQIAGDRVLTGPMAAGPWDTSLQHGAAPAALIAWAAEDISCKRPMQVARITIDLLRPVPIVPLEVRTQLLRQGRKIQLIGIQLIAEGIEVVRASVLKVRIAECAAKDGSRRASGLAIPRMGPQARREREEPQRISYLCLDEPSCR